MPWFILPLLAATVALVKSQTLPHLALRSVSPTATTTAPGESNSACAVVSAASSSYLSASPSANIIVINASIAYDCLVSIPSVSEDALQLLKSFRTYVEFQSDKEYLKNPPSGYANPGYDLDAALDAIQGNIEASAYTSEIDFQLDLYYALQQAYDGHFYWYSDIRTGVFEFALDCAGLASVSIDGLNDPAVYFVADLLNLTGNFSPRDAGFTPSPVTKINGVPVTEAIEILSLTAYAQDPDARYNSQFFSLGRISNILGGLLSFTVPTGQDHFDFEFANGTTVSIAVIVELLQDFTNITDGQAAYEMFAPFANLYSNTSDGAASSAALASASASASASVSASVSASTSASTSATATAIATNPPNIPHFPYPVMKDDSNMVAGYYLNDTKYHDVAVLQITAFEPSSASPPADYAAEFALILSYFLSNATADGKTKLIIDLQGNGGGSVNLGSDTFAQLFPNMAPSLKSNVRRSAGMDIVISSATDSVAALSLNATERAETAFNGQPFDYQENETPDLQVFDSVDDFLNGIKVNDTQFTAFFQVNFTTQSEADGYEISSGDPTVAPPFAPEDMIVLTDGSCGSTCTTVSEHLKNQAGVQFVVVGGRPRHGPVQAIGGIKGSQIFDYSNIRDMIVLFENGTEAELDAVANTEWDYFNKLPMARTAAAAKARDITAGEAGVGGVNGRNSFRIGDETNTPLQYVYEAADCRLWFTPEMLYDPVFLWNRVADIAFNNRTGLVYDSPYCVNGSTGHPTSISGGWKKGTLGPQDQGKIEASSPIFANAPWAPAAGRSGFDWWGNGAGAKDLKVDVADKTHWVWGDHIHYGFTGF